MSNKENQRFSVDSNNDSMETTISSQISQSTEDSSNSNLLKGISKLLNTLIDSKTDNPRIYKKIIKDQKYSIFSLIDLPPFSLEEYLERLDFLMGLEESTIILALMYINSFITYSNIIITPLNVHKIIFTALLITVKFNQDNIYNMQYYSDVSGIDVDEISQMEYEFLNTIKFKLFRQQNEFQIYKEYLTEIIDCF